MLKIGSFQEKVLIGRLKLKDKEAFSKIYDLYIDRIYRFIYFKVKSPQEAEDITSQVFLKVWNYAQDGKIKIDESFQALIYKIARNTVIDHYRSQKNEVSIENVTEIASNENIEEKLDQKIEFQKIKENLNQLKSEYQEIIVLHYINELSIKEIADILEKSKGAVRVTLHRALKTLKDISS